MTHDQEIERQRQLLLAVYSGPAWKLKVSAMHEKQITAVYLKFKKKGLIK